MPGHRTIVIIPTYNEAGNIPCLIRAVKTLYTGIDILVVDDNSPDGTADAVERLSGEFTGVSVLRRKRKEGYGRAYIDAFKYMLSLPDRYEYIMQMDADLSHDPRDILGILEAAAHADICVGSRYTAGGSIVSWGIGRRILSAGANRLVRACLGYPVMDWTGGFRCFRRSAVAAVSIEKIRARGYLFQIEVLFRCLRRGLKVAEVPITFTERITGRTKLGMSEIVEAFAGLLRLAIERSGRDGSP